MDKNILVATVVVTYNRVDLLQECLDAILGQTFQVNKIILIDNASTDGTRDILKKNGYLDHSAIEYHLMKKNLGGSGGFYEGLKIIKKRADIDWAWIMDDDTVPSDTCLESLLLANEKLMSADPSGNVSFLASSVYGESGEFMNVPEVNARPSANGYPYWYGKLELGLVNIKSATFVSILVKKDAIDKCGLPCRDYFIWGDDSEYTTRLTTFYGDAYLVGNSIAIHKRKNAKALDIGNEVDRNRIKMFRYLYRNQAVNAMYYDRKTPLNVLLKSIYYSLKDVKRIGINKAAIQVQGAMEAVRECKKFRSYIDGQIKTGGGEYKL